MIERVLQFTPTPGAPSTDITVRICELRPHGEDFDVTLEIVGFHRPYRQTFPGVDSMSAVLSAARMAPIVLASFAGAGTLTWLGEADLGFPFEPFPDP